MWKIKSIYYNKTQCKVNLVSSVDINITSNKGRIITNSRQYFKKKKKKS